MKKKLSIGIFTLLFCMLLCYKIVGDEKNNMIDKNAVLKTYSVATYTPYDRTLTLNDFSQVKIKSFYDDMVEKLGEPSGFLGSGIVRPYYELSDGSCIIFHVLWGHESSLIMNIEILDMSGRHFVLRVEE